MDNWQYRAYKADSTGNCINDIVEGEITASSFTHLAVLLRQRGLQVLEATRLDQNKSMATQRLSKMKTRVLPPPESVSTEDTKTTLAVTIRHWFSRLIPPFLKH